MEFRDCRLDQGVELPRSLDEGTWTFRVGSDRLELVAYAPNRPLPESAMRTDQRQEAGVLGAIYARLFREDPED